MGGSLARLAPASSRQSSLRRRVLLDVRHAPIATKFGSTAVRDYFGIALELGFCDFWLGFGVWLGFDFCKGAKGAPSSLP